MIIGFSGLLGSGKTLAITTLGYEFYSKCGATIFANYDIKFPCEDIDRIKDLKDIRTKNNILLFDEIWLSADSRRSSTYANLITSSSMLQSRKRGFLVLWTSQNPHQVDNRIRDVTDYLFYPEILMSDENDIPIALRIQTHVKDINNRFIPHNKFYLVTYGHEDLYDTHEVVTKIEDNAYADLIEKYLPQYIEMPLNKSQISSIILVDESISQSTADIVADYILAKRKIALSQNA